MAINNTKLEGILDELFESMLGEKEAHEVVDTMLTQSPDHEEVLRKVFEHHQGKYKSCEDMVTACASEISIYAPNFIVIQADTQKQMDSLKEFCEANQLPIIE